jgi:hypothetical protein
MQKSGFRFEISDGGHERRTVIYCIVIQALKTEIAAVSHTAALKERRARISFPVLDSTERLQFNAGNPC